MRVLFQGYSTYAQNKSGGVQVRMRQLASHLRKSGVDVDFLNIIQQIYLNMIFCIFSA